MRFYSPKLIYPALKLINRHGLFLFPLLAVTFAVIAGLVATDYGAHYLFRDNEKLDYLGLCENGYPCVLQSARLHTALYVTALMGMVWTLFVLIEDHDQNPAERHPVGKVGTVLPGVVLLGLVMVGANLWNREANLWNREANEPFAAVVVLTLLGLLAGLALVTVVTWIGLRLSQWIKIHQLWTFALLSACVAVAVSFLPVLTPSKAVLIMLAAVAIAYGVLEGVSVRGRFPLVLGVGLWVIVATVAPQFKYSFPGLEKYYGTWNAKPGADASRAAGSGRQSLLDPGKTLDAWLGHQRAAKPKLVVVATSGGAYRATFWTTIVLDCLIGDQRLPGFDRAIRLITGASGGMVGGAYFAASRQAGAGVSGGPAQRCEQRALADSPGREMETVEGRLSADLKAGRKRLWVANSPSDSLTPVVQRFIGWDMVLAFAPITNQWDRGRVLEAEWRTLNPTFKDLEKGEIEGWRPSLIVSPYLVDRARPMFISNLNLEKIIKSDFAVEFFREFPEARETFKLATAIRMNATFPFISPAVRLPLPDRPRVVDAGYFDNFGITAAAMFLRGKSVQEFIESKGVEIVFIRILAYDGDAPAEDPGGLGFRLQQITEAVTSPLEGALAARETRGRFANDLLLEDLERMYAGRFHKFQFINPTRASFSWHIQTTDLNEMKHAMQKGNNPQELARLVEVWGN